MTQVLDILLKYPLIERKITENSDIILFKGQILVYSQCYDVVVEQTPTTDEHYNYTLTKLQSKELDLHSEINETLLNNDFQSALEILDYVKEFLESRSKPTVLDNYCYTYKKVLNEYAEFTKFFLSLKSCRLQEDLATIYASVLDEKHREHFIKIAINYIKDDNENIFYLADCDFPEKDHQDVLKPNDSLIALFDECLGQIELFQPYFNVMEEFDRNCTILDPEKPRRVDAYRRIWIGDNVSIIITVDAFAIFQRPDIRFLGPDRLTEPYVTRLNENLENWVCQNDVFQGVLDLLGLDEFPICESKKRRVDLLVEYGECCICYSLRLNEKLPEIICANKSCERFYHNECLYEWLVSLNAKRVFNNISGNCPNCEKTITCHVLD